MNKKISPKTTALVFSTLVVLFLTAFYVSAWTEPTTTPPGGNASTPINVSTTTQYKAGALGIGGVLSAYATINMNNTKITALAEPTDNSDAATKAYVDAKIGGGGGGGGGLDFYQTTGTYNGSTAAGACTSGYHMCLIDEQVGRTYNILLGASGYLDDSSWVDPNDNLRDCSNWTSSSGNGFMASIVSNGWAYTAGISNCSFNARVLCCEDGAPGISAEQSAANFVNAATACRNMAPGNWHLPSAEELFQYVGIAGATGSYLWTTSPSAQIGYPVTIRLTDGNNGNGVVTVTLPFRCVR